ncbi:hypothetical protein L218DRAFT_992573 [Marasmius fiardii PR-910]|nr:hypothetical protein L218DRAFT_992573 [Marasmius fiardii PR-910]
MSTSLTEWAQSKLNNMFELSRQSSEDLQAHFNTTFSPNAQILMNHVPISAPEFQKRISESSGGTAKVSVEWKDVMEDSQAGIVAGFLVLTRSMVFRIRAAPAQNHTFLNISAKIEEDSSAQPDEHGDKRRIVHLVYTSVTKPAAVHLH